MILRNRGRCAFGGIAAVALVAIAVAASPASAAGQTAGPAGVRAPGAGRVAADTASEPRAAEAHTGLRLTLESNIGRLVAGGAAGQFWDEAGGLGTAPGFMYGLGYDARRFGISLGLDVAAAHPEDREGGALTLLVLLHWRPDRTFAGDWRPRLSAGYVRTGVGSTLPGSTITLQSEGRILSETELPGPDVATLGHGARLGAAAERALSGESLSWFVSASVDLLTFRRLEVDGLEQALADPGWSLWPRLSVGLQLHVF